MMINNTFDTNAIHKTCSSGSKIIKPFGPPIYQTEVSQDIVNSLNEEGDKLNVEKNDFRRNLAGNMKTGNSFFYNKEYAKFISKKCLGTHPKKITLRYYINLNLIISGKYVRAALRISRRCR